MDDWLHNKHTNGEHVVGHDVCWSFNHELYFSPKKKLKLTSVRLGEKRKYHYSLSFYNFMFLINKTNVLHCQAFSYMHFNISGLRRLHLCVCVSVSADRWEWVRARVCRWRPKNTQDSITSHTTRHRTHTHTHPRACLFFGSALRPRLYNARHLLCAVREPGACAYMVHYIRAALRRRSSHVMCFSLFVVGCHATRRDNTKHPTDLSACVFGCIWLLFWCSHSWSDNVRRYCSAYRGAGAAAPCRIPSAIGIWEFPCRIPRRTQWNARWDCRNMQKYQIPTPNYRRASWLCVTTYSVIEPRFSVRSQSADMLLFGSVHLAIDLFY